MPGEAAQRELSTASFSALPPPLPASGAAAARVYGACMLMAGCRPAAARDTCTDCSPREPGSSCMLGECRGQGSLRARVEAGSQVLARGRFRPLARDWCGLGGMPDLVGVGHMCSLCMALTDVCQGPEMHLQVHYSPVRCVPDHTGSTGQMPAAGIRPASGKCQPSTCPPQSVHLHYICAAAAAAQAALGSDQ